MENASKALIIAGAILIAILLISVGILVMNSVSKPLDEAGSEANSMAAQMFNSKFVNYAGKKTANEVKSMCLAVQASNASDPNHLIRVRYWSPATSSQGAYVEDKTISENLQECMDLLDDSTTYWVNVHYTYEKNGKLYNQNNWGLDAKNHGVKSEVGYISVINVRDVRSI